MRAWKYALLTVALVSALANLHFFGSLSTSVSHQRFRRAAVRSIAREAHHVAASLQQQEQESQQQAQQATLRHRAAEQQAQQLLEEGRREPRECADSRNECPVWAQAGDCIRNAGPLMNLCRQSCGVCEHYARPMSKVRRMAQLNNGRLMPLMGFGSAGLGRSTHDAVQTALQAGYRLIDTAQASEWYMEAEVGRALAATGGTNRSAIFLTSKLHPRHFGQAALRVQDSLRNLGSDYLDLFLLHYPRCWSGLCSEVESAATASWQVAWRALEPLVERGTIRALGVSNFGLEELAELVGFAAVQPSVVQAYSDPFAANVPLQAFCARAGIQFQAYSSLGSQWLMRGRAENPVLSNAQIKEIAADRGCSPAQVVLLWGLQHRQAVIPRSVSKEHIYGNLEVLAGAEPLDASEMRLLDELDGTLT